MNLRRALIPATCAAACLLTPAVASASDQVIVGFDRDATGSQRERATDIAAVTDVVGNLTDLDATVVGIDGGGAAVVERLEQLPGVAYAEPDARVTTAALSANRARRIARKAKRPNDPGFDRDYGLENRGDGLGLTDADIDAPEGWALAGLGGFPRTGGASVAVIDTGIDRSHPDFAGRIAGCAESRPLLIFDSTFTEGSCSDDNGHGTHVTGILGATADDGQGVAGVAFNSRLLVCRALGGINGDGRISDVAACINWAADRGADVISMSLESGFSPTLGAAVARAWRGGKRSGSVVVAAAGNSGDGTVAYPAGFDQVVSVAATDDRDRHVGFSNRNRDVEVSAPGKNIVSSRLGGGVTTISGTSQAAPYVAGVAAVLRDLHPKWSAKKVRAQLRDSVDDIGPKGRDPKYGFGRINLCLAAGGVCRYR